MTEFKRPKHVKLSGGPLDGKDVGVAPDAAVLHFAADPDETGPRQHRYRIAGDVGTYEGIVSADGGEG